MSHPSKTLFTVLSVNYTGPFKFDRRTRADASKDGDARAATRATQIVRGLSLLLYGHVVQHQSQVLKESEDCFGLGRVSAEDNLNTGRSIVIVVVLSGSTLVVSGDVPKV